MHKGTASRTPTLQFPLRGSDPTTQQAIGAKQRCAQQSHRSRFRYRGYERTAAREVYLAARAQGYGEALGD